MAFCVIVVWVGGVAFVCRFPRALHPSAWDFRPGCGEIPSERHFPRRCAWGMSPGLAGGRAHGNRQERTLALPGGQCSARGILPSTPRRYAARPSHAIRAGFAVVTGWLKE